MIIGLFYIIVPLFLIGIIAFRRQPNLLLWIATILSFGSVIAYMWATARWEMVSIYLRPIFPVLFLIAAVFSFRRIQPADKPPKKVVMILGIGLHALLIIFFSGLNWFSFRGYRTPDQSIELVSPFRSGKQVVLHGGASPFTNGHFHVRPQNHALDIVGLNAMGMRAGSIAGGADLEKYVIYGEQIYSPVDGTVAIVVDEFEDQNPPKTDVEHLAGNHILIESGEVEILLAHLKKGSIAVKVGDRVTINSLLGQVGNTGNTSEPHLHIHVERGGTPKTILNGEANPFTIDQQYLVRGDVMKSQAKDDAKR